MEGKTNKTELIKDVALVVLFAATILLLFLLFNQGGGREISISDVIPGGSKSLEILQPKEVIRPVQVVLSSADGSFFQDNGTGSVSLDKAMDALEQICASSTVMASEISKEQFYAALSEYNSVQINLGCSLPFSDLCSIYEIARKSALDSLGSFSVLAFSEAAKESALLAGDDGKFYRIIGDTERNIVADWKAMANLSRYVFYYAGEVLGGSSKALLSIDGAPVFGSVECVSRGAIDFEENAETLAEAVFGETFDFIRRIKDGFGNITYMYSYGQKSLSAFVDGSFEYRGEAGNRATGFSEDLTTVMGFVESFGGWKVENPARIDFRLSSFKDGQTRSFAFEEYVKGVPVKGNALVVEVTGGQVSYAYRNVLLPKADPIASSASAITAVNAVAANSGYIYRMTTDSIPASGSDEGIKLIAEQLQGVRFVFCPDTQSSLLVPCWATDIGGRELFFDIYSTEPVNYGLE